jgi:hypothetical protein
VDLFGADSGGTGVTPLERLADCLRRVDEIRANHRALPDDATPETVVKQLAALAPARDALEDAARQLIKEMRA